MKLTLQNITKIVASLFFGIAISFGITNYQHTEARSSCSYAYCHVYSGNCYANQNGTDCYGPNGELPCTSSRPCGDPPTHPGEEG